MITHVVRRQELPLGVTQGVISTLHKKKSKSHLTNWSPITLLNVAYILFAKALQKRLQPILMEIIDFDLFAFFPMRFILDNILLTHETMD